MQFINVQGPETVQRAELYTDKPQMQISRKVYDVGLSGCE